VVVVGIAADASGPSGSGFRGLRAGRAGQDRGMRVLVAIYTLVIASGLALYIVVGLTHG
jgi:hypothetical protein